MARRSVREASRAMRQAAQEAAERQDRGASYAEVVRVDPLEAKLTDSPLTLDEDDLVLSQEARIYDKNHGLRKGDSLVVFRTLEGDWVVTSVLSNTKPKLSDEAGQTALTTLASGGVGMILAPDNTTPRGTGFSHYIWICSEAPLNAIENDIWMKPA